MNPVELRQASRYRSRVASTHRRRLPGGRRAAARCAGRASRLGAVVVFYLIALMVLTALLALVVDVGYFYASKAQAQQIADAIAVTSLASAGSNGTGVNSVLQLTRIYNLVRQHAQANGLPTSYWKQSVELDDNLDVVRLTIYRPMELQTLFLNLFDQSQVTVGVLATAERQSATSSESATANTAPVNIFGCSSLELIGNPVLYSRNFTTGTDGSASAARSNEFLDVQGNVIYDGGFLGSSNVLQFTGSTADVDGTYHAPNITGAPGAGTSDRLNEPLDPVVPPPGVEEATALDNDNNRVSGCDSSFNLGFSYVLQNSGAPGTVSIPAGSKIYARSVYLLNDTLEITGDPRSEEEGGDGPVVITLDAAGGGGSFFSDTDFTATVAGGMKPEYLRVIGVNPPYTCCTACSGAPTFIVKHNVAYGLLYIPGWAFEVQSNPTFHGSVIAEKVLIQGNALFIADEENGFDLSQNNATPTMDPEKARLVN